jgi:hypothetical protein
VVEGLDVQARLLAELLDAQARVLDVPAHRQIGAVDLEDQAGLRHGLVLVPHGLRDRGEIRLLGRVVVVAEEERDHAG